MDITMYEYRKMLKKAAKAMSVGVATHTRLNTADIMALCGQLDPEPYRNYNPHLYVVNFPLVPTGGKLLAGYMTMMAPPELYKAWRRHYKAQRRPDAVPMTIEEFHPWSKVIGSRFHGFMLTAQSLYKAQNKQRFFMTFVARYHGLSQMGSDLMSSLGWLVPSTTYDRGVLEVLRAAKAINRLGPQIIFC